MFWQGTATHQVDVWAMSPYHSVSPSDGEKSPTPNPKHTFICLTLVSGLWFQPLWKIVVSWEVGIIIPNIWKKHVPNHQPGMIWRFLKSWRLFRSPYVSIRSVMVIHDDWMRTGRAHDFGNPKWFKSLINASGARTPPVGSHLHQRYSARVGVLDTCSTGAMDATLALLNRKFTDGEHANCCYITWNTA